MKRANLYFILVAGLTLLADQLSKAWAIGALKEDRFRSAEHAVWADYFHWSYAENPGATFSFLAGVPEYVRLPLFALIAAGAGIGISIYYAKLSGRHLALRTALGFLWAGALGNWIDRLRFTYVVDFIDVHYKNEYTWPTFNVADIAIVIGIALFFFFGEPDGEKKKAAPAH
jgi:signal peptidase II